MTTPLTVYAYNRCSTCRQAIKWLEAQGHTLTVIQITDTPPPAALLRAILDSGDYTRRELFNTSGVQYRELGMKDRLPTLSDDEAIDLLAANGKLCKRPIVTDGTRHTVGFREATYASTWAR